MVKKKRGRPKKKKGLRLGMGRRTFFSVFSLFFFLLTAFLMISFLRQTHFLSQANEKLFTLFGGGTFFLPFLTLLLGLLLSGINLSFLSFNVFLGSFLFFFSLLGLFKNGQAGHFLFQKTASFLGGAGSTVAFFVLSLAGFLVFWDVSLREVSDFLMAFWEKVKEIFTPKKKREMGDKFPPVSEMTPLVSDFESQGREEKTGLTKISAESQGGRPKEGLPLAGARLGVWHYPPLSLLDPNPPAKQLTAAEVNKNADIIEKTLDSFGISAKVVEVNPGPAVTQYAIRVAPGTKLSKILSLSNDLALALAAPTGQIRIEAPIVGRSLAGIELPNSSLRVVNLRQMLASPVLKKSKSRLTVGLGLDVSGQVVAADIGKMPHVLIAGQTGAGKSVLLNAWICTLLSRATPEEVKMILIDPKRVELTQYEGIPHLLSSVIVEPPKVVSALKWATKEMDNRYKLFAEAGVRNIDDYNEKAGFAALPYLVIIIDELADIMFFSPAEVETAICRLAQMARATGIHLVIATQRPSVDVLTGLIKANIPCRISFAVASMTDSRVILDTPGAEKLLGRGDMLYLPPDRAKPLRIQGAYVSDREIKNLINFVKNMGVEPVYTQEVVEMPIGKKGATVITASGERDELFDEAVELFLQENRASSSLLQRRFRIGYNRAARLLDQMEEEGIVGPPDGSKSRELLVNKEKLIVSENEDSGTNS
ncbi:DNA translocase FtsK [Candidatus Shapirobacteria bacterium]|nr:DNA translocase FtsK [Candidatus Shapirobacteria bacterium]